MEVSIKRLRTCHLCGSEMELVAEVPPFMGGMTLRAFVCADCGRSESQLCPPERVRLSLPPRDPSCGA